MLYHNIDFIETKPTHSATDKSCSSVDDVITTLNARNQNLTDFPITEQLQHLTKLDLSKNSLTELVLDLDMLELEFLDLSYNKVPLEKVIFNGHFPKLKYLYVYESQLKSIEFAYAMPNLEILNLGKNQLEKINLPYGFEALESLTLNNNQIKNVGIEIANSKDVRSSNTNDFPLNPFVFPKIAYLNLQENPVQDISPEVIAEENCLEHYRSIFVSAYKSPMVYLHEAKMILFGNGEVGKTSIRLKLLDKNAVLPEKKDRTQGLDISTYRINNLPSTLTNLEESIDFDLHIWDFGGQGKYREVQQLFCSRKSLYVFVTAIDDQSTKEDYVNYDYWLSMAQTYGSNPNSEEHSPIIYVCNKSEIEKHGLKDDDEIYNYKNIPYNLLKISCKTYDNFPKLINLIKDHLPQISTDVFTNKFAQNWLNVKIELEQRENDHYLNYTDYLEICTKNNLDSDEAKSWLSVLGRIGTVIHFGENPNLKDWIVLNPNWVKTAIYEIIDKGDIFKDGELTLKQLAFIWQAYTQEEQKKLLELILEFKLCYQSTSIKGETIYIFPSLLGAKPKIHAPKLKKACHHLKLEYQKFIPAGIVNKLMVMLHQQIYQSLKWKNGFVIESADETAAYAIIEENWEAKNILITLFGKNVRPLFSLIVQCLTHLNNELKETKLLTKLAVDVFTKDKDGNWHDLKTIEKYDKTYWGFEIGIAERGFIFDDQFIKPSKLLKQNMNSQKLKQLIAENELEEVLDILGENVPQKYEGHIILLKSRFNSLSKEDILGLDTKEGISVEGRTLANNILSLLEKLERKGFIDNNPIEPIIQKPKATVPSPNPTEKRKILFLAAAPKNMARLGVDEEFREVKKQITASKYRDKVSV